MGKFKDWETIVLKNDNQKTCFAQTKPVLQSPKKNKRESRLFVSFRPNEKVKDEISTTSGYEYNKKNSITAKSGKKKFKFDIIIIYSGKNRKLNLIFLIVNFNLYLEISFYDLK